MLLARARRRTDSQRTGGAGVLRKTIAVLASTLVVGSLVTPVAAHAADTAGLKLQKSVSATTVMPGETFNWIVEVGCSVLDEECINAQLIDTIPDEFTVGSAAQIAMTPALVDAGLATVDVTGQVVTVDFDVPLSIPAGQHGLDNQIVTVTIPVTVRTDLQYTPEPVTVTNTATITADNAPDKTSSASTSLTVPLQVATTAAKAFTPSTVLGSAGSATTVTVGGTNTSNSLIDSFVIQDPKTPASDTIFASTLRVDSLGDVVWPAGADAAVVSVWDASVPGWVDAPEVAAGDPLALPASANPADIRGVRIAFSSAAPAMPTGATASFELGTVVRAGAGSGARSNTSTSTVSVHGSAATNDATRSLTLTAASSSVAATKTIAPDRLASKPYQGQDLTEATVTLTARNSGTLPLTSLTISEPTTASDLSSANPLAPEHPGGGLTFQAFGGVTWPSGATAAQITYHYATGPNTSGNTTTVGTLPSHDTSRRVTGFTVTFTGTSMPGNAQATLPFTVKTNPAQTESVVNVDNRIAVSGVNTLGNTVSATANDTAIIYGERLDIATSKSITRNELLAVPGQQTTATLTTTVLPYPQSSIEATQIVQYDPPGSETGLTEWYTYFDPTSLIATGVPGGATLTVQYRDSAGSWANVPLMAGLDHSGSPYTLDFPDGIRDAIHGIRLVWESPSGFVPGSALTANINYQLRSPLRGTTDPLPNEDLDDTLINCSSADGWIGSTVAPDATANSGCPVVNLRKVEPGTGEGTGGLPLYKQFRTTSGSTGTTVTGTEKDITYTRSSERTGVRLSWSTGGRTGVQSMTITDAAVTSGSVDAGSYTKGMYDAFNLVRINAINNSIDPFLQYDRVAIQLFNKDTSTWETPEDISCITDAPCTTFGGYNLTAAEQELYVGVRFIYTERPGRTGLDQPAGAGVAVSTGNERGITLVYAIRDTLRSDAGFPVVDGPLYNAGLSADHSVIRNDAHAAAVTAAETLQRTVADTIELRDANLQLDVTKTWEGGPLPLIADPVPTSRVTLRTTNQTPSPSTVSELIILEPNPDTVGGDDDDPPAENPFEHFDLTRLYSLTHPAGATVVSIIIRDGTGAVLQSVTGGASLPLDMAEATNTARGWAADDLAAAQSIEVRYQGRMGVNAYAELKFDLAVRTTLRDSVPPVAIAPDTVDNGTRGSVSDLRYDPASDPESPVFVRSSLTDKDRASIQLQTSTIDVVAGKSFTPASQPEGVRDPITMTLTGTPAGTQRVAEVVLTDDRASFWNAFDLDSAGTFTLPTFTSTGGTARLQVEACTGGSFVAVDIAADPELDCATRGGTWQGAGTWLSQTQLTGGAFLPSGVSAGDVTGLRLTVKRSDNTQWENPHAPTITINLNVQRRENLRSGGAVPSEYAGNAAAPGESAVGTTTNAVTAKVTGIWGSTATDSTTATYRFTHLTSSVQVSKLPVGMRTPGVRIPYELTILNTGQLPIENPVITDRFPTDAEGAAMLIFNPDGVTSYTLSTSGGTIPDGSLAIPNGSYTDSVPGVLTISTTTDAIGPTEISFAFPAGTVIGVGQTVKVTIPLFFRPGLSHGTTLQNVFDVTGDRLLDACTAPSGSAAPATMVSDDRGCETSASVTIAKAPSLRAVIASQALETPGIDFPAWDDADSQFTGASNEVCRAAQDASGFSRPDCAPQTIPGQDSTWRLTVQNTGTTELSRLVVATRLPALADQTIVSGLTRNSAWYARFNGEIESQFGAGATVQVYYTTMDQPCVGVLDQPSDPAACGTDPATGWALLPADDPGFDPAVVTGLQFVVDFADTAPYLPGAVVTVDIGTTTVAELDVFEDGLVSDPLAVNSLSVSGISPSATIQRISSLDYSRALLSLATGAVTLSKSVIGDAASFVPDGTEFHGQLVCTSLGESLTRPFQFSVSGGVVSPASITFENLPGGADCTVTETAASGQTNYTANTVTVDPLAGPAALPSISLVNDYQLASIQVGKTVTSTAPVIPTGYAFTVTCTFLGQDVPLAAEDASFTLDAGQTRTITGLPANADCVVIETDAQDADATIASASTDAAHGGSIDIDNDTRTVEFENISPDTVTGTATNTVDFDNRFDAPAILVISKELAGGAAEQFGEDKTFTVHVYCTFGDTIQYDAEVSLAGATGWQATIDNLIAGSECAFTETGLQGADAVVITPNDGTDETTGVLVVPDTATPVVQIEVTNWYLTGAVAVTKTFAGDDGAIEKFAVEPGIEFEFTLLCLRDGVEVQIPGGATRTVTAADPVAQYTGLASGADCVLTETATGGAGSWQVLDENGELLPGGEFTVEVDATVLADDQQQPVLGVENTFRFAEVSAVKIVRSDDGAADRGPFEVTLLCTLDGRPIEAAEPGVRTVRHGETVVWTELAEGAECILAETDRGGATRTDVALLQLSGELSPAVEAASVELAPLRSTADEVANQVRFINTFELPDTGAALALSPQRMLLLSALVLSLGAVAVLWALRRRAIGEVTA